MKVHRVKPRRKLTPADLRAAMERLGFKTQSAFAAALGRQESTVSMWLSGARAIQAYVGVMIEGLEAQFAARTSPIPRKSSIPKR